jgi:hypothetical protein
MGRGLYGNIQSAIHMNEIAPFAFPKRIGIAHDSCAASIRFYNFRERLQQARLCFCSTRGKMNTGNKHCDLTQGNAVGGTREVSKGGPGGLPLAHDLARNVPDNADNAIIS